MRLALVIIALVACGTQTAPLPKPASAKHESQRGNPFAQHQTIDAGDADADPWHDGPIRVAIGSEHGTHDVVEHGWPTLPWDDIHYCYTQTLALRRYRRQRLAGTVLYLLSFREGVVVDAHVETDRDAYPPLPQAMVSCLDDVLKNATYTYPTRRDFRVRLEFYYEEPPKAGP